MENVNPVTKVVHVPSLQSAIEKAITNIERIPRGFEALMFSIYSMAVLSLTEDQCRDMLGDSRAMVLPRYVAATKAALLRARFMSSTSIVVMQALVLHILSIRDVYDSRAVWSLNGLAIRVAQGMGMGLDGTLLGLSPFETEIRRRIWWQLKMQDSRAAELSGQAKFQNFELNETTPKRPANIEDNDLYPAMMQAATESTRPTEMIWIVLRSELASYGATMKADMKRQGKVGFTSEEYAAMDDMQIKDDYITKIEDMVETKFLRFCDPSEPLQLMVLLTARCATNIIQFVAHHPRRWAHLDQVPASEQQLVWGIAFKLLERYSLLQSNPQLQRFAWNVPYYIQWHAVIHVLDTLRTDPLHADAAKAWRLIDSMYEMNSEMLLNANKPIFVAVGNLCLKAFTARATALVKEGRGNPKPPEYITNLQKQRQSAKARREAALTRRKGHDTLSDENKASISNDIPHKTHLQQPPSAKKHQQPTNPLQPSTHTGDDAFWLGNAPAATEDNFISASDAGGVAGADTMNLDMYTDTILSEDYNSNSNNNNGLDTPYNDSEVIDWAQWDAWLGGGELIRPK